MTAAIEVSAVRTEDLGADTRAAIVQVCVAAFQNDKFKELFTVVPAGGRHFLAYAGGEVVSHGLVTTRWLQPEGQPLLKTAYVDAVGTQPGRQRQGFGSAVMRQLAADVAADFSVACLETRSPGFYERLGWQEWCGPLAGRGEAGLVPTPGQTGIMVLRLPLTPPLDFARGLTIEATGGRIW